jgi:hypothetical protein
MCSFCARRASGGDAAAAADNSLANAVQALRGSFEVRELPLCWRIVAVLSWSIPVNCSTAITRGILYAANSVITFFTTLLSSSQMDLTNYSNYSIPSALEVCPCQLLHCDNGSLGKCKGTVPCGPSGRALHAVLPQSDIARARE